MTFVLIMLSGSVSFSDSSTKYDREYSIDDCLIKIDYSISSDVIVETITLYESNYYCGVIVRTIDKNNHLKVYRDGELLFTGHADYQEFDYLITNEAEIVEVDSNVAQVYYPCGRDELHTLVSRDIETINIRNQTLLLSTLITILTNGWGLPASLVMNLIQNLNHNNASYIDVDTYKFYLHNYSLDMDMNCYHIYSTSYFYNDSGEMIVVDAYNQYYQVVL